MGLEIGLLCGEYVGCECKSIRSVSRAKAPIMEKAHPKNPIVVILDNARIQELEDRGVIPQDHPRIGSSISPPSLVVLDSMQ